MEFLPDELDFGSLEELDFAPSDELDVSLTEELDDLASLLEDVTLEEDFASLLLEVVVLEDKVVAGCYHNLSVRVNGLDVPSRPRIAWRCVATRWFKQDLLGLDLWQLLLYNRLVLLISEHDNILGGNNALQAIDRELQQATPSTQEINELFWHCSATIGPKAAPHATTHYNTISISFHILLLR